MGNDVVNKLHEIAGIGLLCLAALIWITTKILTTWVFWKSMRTFEKISDSVSALVKTKDNEDR